MQPQRNHSKSVLRTIRDYAIITVAMLIGVIRLNLFLVPNHITMGGTMGIAEIL